MTPRRLRPAAGALAALLVVVLAGCTPAGKDQNPVDPSSGTASSAPGSDAAPAGDGAPTGFESYYTQDLAWKKCGGGFECATAAAPISWDDADSGSIDLALKRLPASGDRKGSLLTDPGGPGASGVEFVGDAKSLFGDPVRESYDIVGFDPRGVSGSSPVRCFDDARKDESLSKDFPETDAGLADLRTELKAWADACQKNTGPQLATVDTQSAARDMDMLRAALGDGTLTYVGFSYGTQLGATYAGLFPDRVGRMVLDGAIDTSLDADEISAQQAVGFENALRAYVKDCQTGKCPLTGSVDDGMAQIKDLLDGALDDPLPTDSDRDLTQTLMFYGIALPLYSKANWPLLTQALTEAIDKGTGTTFLLLSDYYNDRNPDGSYTGNSAEAFRAVNCLDDPGNPDMAFMDAQAKQIEAAAPTMGEFFTYNGLTCADWPEAPVKKDFDLHAKGAAPIVVVGTTNDPATPYVWAQGLAKTLDSGRLLTYQGEGHTAYGSSNSCIGDSVDDYLVDGTLPAEGKTC
ncbi:alpha/beta hydrolase [Cellulomonas sp. PhB143]|uniref:alpha/beta hydrolase n=1 Tax=Cellulomonas sp. PhB143 TaxID=2485186 RepID=UPI000F468148|nr:alpha/beta hydrolase [Cellulomonas sp. PhB143]ROS76618.1 alpha/beta hydrolase family protein [Cellulomonas sp. PhB143]